MMVFWNYFSKHLPDASRTKLAIRIQGLFKQVERAGGLYPTSAPVGQTDRLKYLISGSDRFAEATVRSVRVRSTEVAVYSKKKGFSCENPLRWRWGESNPCPNTTYKSFLHAYSGIDCREAAGAGQTNFLLSCMVLDNGHSLPLPHPVFVLSRLRSLVTGKPASAAQMTI
jgi:hypothetical protein